MAISRFYRQSRREREREQRFRDRDHDIEKEYQHRVRDFERGEEQRIKALKREFRALEIAPEPTEREKRRYIERELNSGKSEADEREWRRGRDERRHERLREQEKDISDRTAVQREAEEEKRKKEEEERRVRRELEEAKRKAKVAAEEEKRILREEERKRKETEQRELQEAQAREWQAEQQRREVEQKKQQEVAAAKLLLSVQEEMRHSSGDTFKREPVVSGSVAGPPGHQNVEALFRESNDEPNSQGQVRKHRPLTRLDGSNPAEVKLRGDEMRRLIQQVPTDKTKAFTYPIDWRTVHEHNIIEKKLRPWVKKKVIDYLGTEEQGMIEFIMRKVSSHTPPDTILAELEGFLDEEAENFTLKMWRMLIFEVLRVTAAH